MCRTSLTRDMTFVQEANATNRVSEVRRTPLVWKILRLYLFYVFLCVNDVGDKKIIRI